MSGKTQKTKVHCSICGRVVGIKAGVQVSLGIICTDPFCNYQEPPGLNEARDALLVAGYLEGIPVVQIAHSAGMSRQRVYQIIDSWKSGV